MKSLKKIFNRNRLRNRLKYHQAVLQEKTIDC
jgi:hypothetical protein